MKKSRMLTILYIAIILIISFAVYKSITSDSLILQGDSNDTYLFDDNLWQDNELDFTEESEVYSQEITDTASYFSSNSKSSKSTKSSSYSRSSRKTSSKKTSSKKTSSKKTSSKASSKPSSKASSKSSSKPSSKASSKVSSTASLNASSKTSSKSPSSTATSTDDESDTVTSVEYGVININTADFDALCSLPGIGETLANRIIEFRENSGEFNSIEEIMYVSGIGEGKFDAIKDLITVE